MDYKFSAFVLGKKEIGETDRIYSFLTKENGKVRAIGRGTRKAIAKLAGNLETLNQVEVFISKSKGLGNISGVIPVNVFSGIKNDIIILKETFSVFQILDSLLPEEQMEKKIYEYLESFLNLAEENIIKNKEIDFQLLKTGLMLKILEELGYRFEVEKCVECGKKLSSGGNRFDLSRGGVICQKCGYNFSSGLLISDDSIKAIRIISTNKIENLLKLKLGEKNKKEMEIIIEAFYNWIRG